MFAGQNLSDSGEKLAEAASLPSTPSETLKTNTPPSSLTEADTPAPTVIMGEVQKELPPFVGGNPHLLERTVPPDGLMRAKEPAARSAAFPATGTTAKKTADDGSNQLPSSEPAKQVLTPAANPSLPALPTSCAGRGESWSGNVSCGRSPAFRRSGRSNFSCIRKRDIRQANDGKSLRQHPARLIPGWRQD